MSVYCEFIDLIIPIANIDRIYWGGFKKFKEKNIEYFGKRMWQDEYLYRDGAMNPMDMEQLVKKWEYFGLKGLVEEDGKEVWKDFCVFQAMMGGAHNCDWIGFDSDTWSAYLIGKPKGKVVMPDRKGV